MFDMNPPTTFSLQPEDLESKGFREWLDNCDQTVYEEQFGANTITYVLRRDLDHDSRSFCFSKKHVYTTHVVTVMGSKIRPTAENAIHFEDADLNNVVKNLNAIHHGIMSRCVHV